MKTIKFNYGVDLCSVIDGPFESTVELSDGDLRKIGEVIKAYPGEKILFNEIPQKVLDKFIFAAAEDDSQRDEFERYRLEDIILPALIPATVLDAMCSRTVKLLPEGYYEESKSFENIDDDTEIVELDTDADIETICGEEGVHAEDLDVSGYDDVDVKLLYKDEPTEETEEWPEPTKENTMYITIKQVYFDAILDGSKKEEYREIKPTTYKRYLECYDNGVPCINDNAIEGKDPDELGSIYCYNKGVYPYIPKDYLYLDLAVGYNKDRDTATVKVLDITFEPIPLNDGTPATFHDEKGEAVWDPKGKLCFWNVVYHLGDVVKKSVK